MSLSLTTDFNTPDTEEQPSNGFFADHPSYFVAADAHTIGNDQGSMLDPTTWGDRAENVGKFAVSAVTRAVASTWNIVPEVGNFFGADMESDKLDTEQILRNFDNSLGDYYVDHKQGVDIVGDIAATLVPGMGGVKVLNWGQRALKMIPEGNFGYNIARSIGTLPDMSADFAAKAAKSMAQDSGTFNWVNSNMIKSVAAGYAQNALEFGMYEASAATLMPSSPLFDNETAGDIAYNALIGGGVVGAGVMGTLSAIKTYGGIKSALKATDTALFKSKYTEFAQNAADPSDKIIAAAHNKDFMPLVAEDDPLHSTKIAEQQKTIRVIDNEMRVQYRTLSSDDELGNILADNQHGVDSLTVMQNMLGVKEAVRAGFTSDTEKAANKAMKEAVATKDEEAIAAAQTAQPTNRYLKLSGEGAGTVSTTAPKVMYLADSMKSRESVLYHANHQKFAFNKVWDVFSAGITHADVEARMIWVNNAKLPELEKIAVGANDTPLLERLYTDKVPTVKLTNGTELNYAQLRDHIDALKDKIIATAKEEDSLNTKKNFVPRSDAEVAKLANVTESYVQNVRNVKNPFADMFAEQAASQGATAMYRAKGLTLDPSKVVDTMVQPHYAKIVYDTAKVASNTIDDKLVDGITYISQLYKINKVQADNVFADYAADKNGLFMDAVPERILATANRFGAGARLFAAASGAYDTLASYVEYIGKGTATLKRVAIDKVDTSFSGHFYKFANDPKLGRELGVIRQQMLSTPEKYILAERDEGGFMLQARKLSEWTGEGAEPAIDKAVPAEIPVSDEMAAFLKDWVAHNDEQLGHRYAMNAVTGKQSRDLTQLQGNVYFPQPNPKDYKHWAMVVDPSVSNTGHKSLITAANEEALQQQVKKVQQQYPELKVLFKKEIEEQKLALGEYDFDLGINENYIDAAKQRSGVAPFFPNMDGGVLATQLRDWRASQDVNIARDMVAMKYERAFSSLQRMGKQSTLETTSTFNSNSIRKYSQSTILDPYNNYVKTALDISSASEYKLWQSANDLAENAIGGLMNKISGIWAKVATPDDLGEINNVLQEAGINRKFEDAATYAWASHTAPKPYLSKFIRGANSILTTLMLRADPGNAMNNGLGSIVLTGKETQDVLAKIARADKDTIGKLADISTVRIPGTGDSFYSPMKLIGSAYGDWWKAVAGGDAEVALRNFYKEQGWSTNLYDQFKSIADSMTLEGNETPEQLHSKLLAGVKKTGNFVAQYSGNNFAEEMNRFVSSNIAQKISDVGVKAGIITKDDQKAFINTFINRTQGNYLASQRPIAFQGPIGQAVGLFQTYQFNMMQHIFRNIAEGNKKNLAVLMALQGTIYGINGLPAVNAINDHLIGNAAGNKMHSDIFSTVKNTAGNEFGDWLLYGLSSNFLLHPDLKINLYSRGDINPRSVTVIPTTIQEVPLVSAAATLFSSLKESGQRMGAGGDVYTSILQGIEHAGLNRPLAGLATVLEGFGNGGKSYSTTTKGQLVMSNDLLSLANLSRLLGAKPLDEAVARDAMYRTKVYSADRQNQINTIGAAIKGKIMQGSVPTSDDMNNFLSEYVRAGGTQQNFNKFYGRLVTEAKTSQVNKMSDNLKNPFSQYMQKIMGGYDLEDMRNTQ